MLYRFPTLFVLLAFCFSYSVLGQSEINSYTDKAAFASAVEDQKILDFEGVAANSGFVNFKREGHFTFSGVDFRPGGGARFGPGHVTIVGPWYQAGPAYETTSGAKLIWSPPNQPGNAYIDIQVPDGTTAVGTDVWAAQPYVSPVEVVATASDGTTRTVTINTPQRPAAGFVGFTSNTRIVSLRLTPAKGQTGLVIDNLVLGRSSGRALTASEPAERPASVREEVRSQPRQTSPGTQTSQRVRSGDTTPAVDASGSIAYVRGDTEIRMISPDGSGDRRLWTHKDLHEGVGLYELAWRPDGKELAFSSAHEAVASFYIADIYTIRPDGSGLRKLTNAPDITEFSRYPKGSVTVTVRNGQPVNAPSGVFIIYVAGADEPQQVNIPAGTAKTLVFKSVADFGNHPQPVVAMFGKYRWFSPGTDVHAGRTVTSPTFSIGGDGIDMFGAFRPVWRSDGSQISYRSGLCIVSKVPVNPTPGEYSFDPLFGGKNPMGTCTWDWGPTPDTANQIIYTENSSGGSNIYRINEGGTHPGTKVTPYSDLDYQLLADLHWLPDASGLLFSKREFVLESADIYRYDFATKKVTQITDLKNEFAQRFSISPDGRSVVFERCKERDSDKNCDLWIASTHGGGMRLLVKNGSAPAWGR